MIVASATVLPIAPGAEASLALDLDAEFFDLFLRAPRLQAQLRSVTGDALFLADSAAGAIRRQAAHVVAILLPRDVTARMAGLRAVEWDFAAFEQDGAQREVPGLFSWPVRS